MRPFGLAIQQFKTDISAPVLASCAVSVGLLWVDVCDCAIAAILCVQVGEATDVNYRVRIEFSIEYR